MRSTLCLFFAAASSLLAGTVYTQDFEGSGPIPEWTGAGSVQTSAGLGAVGFGLQHFKNDGSAATTLTLTGLAPHSFIDLTFDLAMWDSLDWGSDIFQVSVNGVFAINQTFGNYFAPGGCPSGCIDGPGTALTPGPTDFSNPQFGYNSFRDSARRVNFQIADSAGTAVISFQFPNTQGAPDEAFGVDNILVQTDADAGTPGVPEPASMMLALGGLAAGAAWRRRCVKGDSDVRPNCDIAK
jgi:MYXO-CTERM domain-containing protein